MTIFNVFLGAGTTFSDQVAGTKKAGREFRNYYTPKSPANPTPGPKIFKEFIVGLIEDSNCLVTYKDNQKTVAVRTNPGGQKSLVYVQAGVDVPINLQADVDDGTNNVVNMAVPAVPVHSDSPPARDYLSDAVDYFTNHPDGPDEKRAFLLGLLLLKRCR